MARRSTRSATKAKASDAPVHQYEDVSEQVAVVFLFQPQECGATGRDIRRGNEAARDSADRGLILYGRREYEAAIDAFKVAIELEPEFAEAFHWLGLANQAIRKSDESLANIEKAIELDPRDPHKPFNQGIIFYSLKQYAKARRSFKRAITQNAGFGLAYFWHGLSDIQLLGDTSAANALCQAATLGIRGEKYDLFFRLLPHRPSLVEALQKKRNDPNAARLLEVIKRSEEARVDAEKRAAQRANHETSEPRKQAQRQSERRETDWFKLALSGSVEDRRRAESLLAVSVFPKALEILASPEFVSGLVNEFMSKPGIFVHDETGLHFNSSNTKIHLRGAAEHRGLMNLGAFNNSLDELRLRQDGEIRELARAHGVPFEKAKAIWQEKNLRVDADASTALGKPGAENGALAANPHGAAHEEELRKARRLVRAHDRRQAKMKKGEAEAASPRPQRVYEKLRSVEFEFDAVNTDEQRRSVGRFIRAYERLTKGPLAEQVRGDEALAKAVRAARTMMKRYERSRGSSAPAPG